MCHPTGALLRQARVALVERFDIEPFSDFSAKWANFIGLVLFCIDAKFCKKIRVGMMDFRWKHIGKRDSLKSSWRDLQDLHAFVPLSIQICFKVEKYKNPFHGQALWWCLVFSVFTFHPISRSGRDPHRPRCADEEEEQADQEGPWGAESSPRTVEAVASYDGTDFIRHQLVKISNMSHHENLWNFQLQRAGSRPCQRNI